MFVFLLLVGNSCQRNLHAYLIYEHRSWAFQFNNLLVTSFNSESLKLKDLNGPREIAKESKHCCSIDFLFIAVPSKNPWNFQIWKNQLCANSTTFTKAQILLRTKRFYNFPWLETMFCSTTALIFLLVGGFNPFEKYESNWDSSPIFGVKIKNLETATQS